MTYQYCEPDALASMNGSRHPISSIMKTATLIRYGQNKLVGIVGSPQAIPASNLLPFTAEEIGIA